MAKRIDRIKREIKENLSSFEVQDEILFNVLSDKLEQYEIVRNEIKIIEKLDASFKLDELNKAIKLQNILFQNILSILDRLEFNGDMEDLFN